MFRRPASSADGLVQLQNVLKNTEMYKNKEVYTILWHGGDLLLNGSWAVKMLMPLCNTSEITSFIWKTAVPCVEELLTQPDRFANKVDEGLSDPKVMDYVQETYTLLQSLVKSANKALERDDADEAIKQCARECIKMMDNAHVAEGFRLVTISSGVARLCFRIGIPRMVDTFENDTTLQAEGMNMDIAKMFMQ